MGAEETLAIMRQYQKPLDAQDVVHKYAYKWLQISSARRKKKKKRSSWWSHLRVLRELLCRMFDTIIARLDLIVEDYRKVGVILDQEKRVEKQKLKIQALPWIVLPFDKSIAVAEERRFAVCGDANLMASGTTGSNRPRLLRFIVAIKDALLSLSEFLCYFVMILNAVFNASILSLPFPISVFLWAMLSVPRPDTVYWITMIFYTEFVLLVKYFFRFGFFSWNNGQWHTNDPLYGPRIFGIDRLYSFEKIDMILLFVLFFHRSLLKSKGIWHTAQKAAENLNKAKHIIENDLDKNIQNVEEDVTTHSSFSSVYVDYNAVDTAWSQRSRKWGFLIPFQQFYYRITEGPYNIVTDVYALMFLCDAIGFIIVSFSYKNFAPVTESHNIRDVASAITENRVPPAFLFMLLSLFVFMLVDRVIYLRRLVFGKFILQIVLVLGTHAWMFFILPYVNNRAFSHNFTAQLWYFFKCLYFGLSAYQIRCRYPARILGNFLTKQYNYTNLVFFKIFQVMPFLLEIRYLMDWMWTDTALGLYSWMQMEDIYNKVFTCACFLAGEDRYVTPRATKRSPVIKYGLGGILLFILFLIVWFPMLVFSVGGTVFMSKAPKGFSLSIHLDSYK
ncbi:Piezo-type mechanosensitive ion channel component 2, partial [Lamellibrachia satsuma]